MVLEGWGGWLCDIIMSGKHDNRWQRNPRSKLLRLYQEQDDSYVYEVEEAWSVVRWWGKG